MNKLKIIKSTLSILAISLITYFYGTEAICSGGKNNNTFCNCKYFKNCSIDWGICSVCKKKYK